MSVRIENDRLIVPVEVPASQVEAVLLDWQPKARLSTPVATTAGAQARFKEQESF